MFYLQHKSSWNIDDVALEIKISLIYKTHISRFIWSLYVL